MPIVTETVKTLLAYCPDPLCLGYEQTEVTGIESYVVRTDGEHGDSSGGLGKAPDAVEWSEYKVRLAQRGRRDVHSLRHAARDRRAGPTGLRARFGPTATEAARPEGRRAGPRHADPGTGTRPGHGRAEGDARRAAGRDRGAEGPCGA